MLLAVKLFCLLVGVPFFAWVAALFIGVPLAMLLYEEEERAE